MTYNPEKNLFEQGMTADEMAEAMLTHISKRGAPFKYYNGQNSLGAVNTYVWHLMTQDISKYLSANKPYDAFEYSNMCDFYLKRVGTDFFELDDKRDTDRVIYSEMLDTWCRLLKNLPRLEDSTYLGVNKLFMSIRESFNRFSGGAFERLLDIEYSSAETFKDVVEALFIDTHLERFYIINRAKLDKLENYKAAALLDVYTQSLVKDLKYFYTISNIEFKMSESKSRRVVKGLETRTFNTNQFVMTVDSESKWICQTLLELLDTEPLNHNLCVKIAGNLMALRGLVDTQNMDEVKEYLETIGARIYGTDYQAIKENAYIFGIESDPAYWINATHCLKSNIEDVPLPAI